MPFRFILSILLLLFVVPGFSQGKKPTIMILPSDNWCEQRYFVSTFDNQGIKVKTPNYQQAFIEDAELPLVISKVGGMLSSRGYSIKDAEQETKAAYARMTEDNLTISKSSGSSIAESPLDIIKRRAKMDILIQIWWKINKEPSGKSVSYILEAFDSYTSKRIATASGTSSPSTASVPHLLESAFSQSIKDFDRQLTSYFRDITQNGREIVLTVRCWDSWDNDLETEYGDDELVDCIQKWMRQNTVGSSFNLSDQTENFAQFEQVRIPVYDQDGSPMDARAFATSLRKYLSKSPFNITSKVLTRGLGEAIIVLGEK